MMFREPVLTDRDDLIALMDEFYHSSAVLHACPKEHYERTFDALMENTPYAKAYLIESDGALAGYALLGITWSNEGGGLSIWIDELYIRPQFQGKGLGKALLTFLHEQWGDQVTRFRLETESNNDGARRLYQRLGYEDLPYLSMILDKK